MTQGFQQLQMRGHWIRVKNQQIQIKEIYESMQQDKCLILIDYKMKFDPIYFQEKTVDHLGKKELS